MNKEQIAQVAHEINKSFCLSIGDKSQPSWEDSPQWQKDSAIAGVEFHLQNPNAKPSQSHESWLAQKEKDGWKYGPVKNAEIKEHPCFVPYEQLPVEQQSKDYLFKQVVESLKTFLEEQVICEGCSVSVDISKARIDDDGVWLCQDCYEECIKSTNQDEE